MHNNVKFVLRDEDIQVWWGQLVFRFILRVGVCAFPHVLGMEKSKKLPPTSRGDNFWNSPKGPRAPAADCCKRRNHAPCMIF